MPWNALANFKWQRARIIEGRGGAYHLDGRLVWVEIGPPKMTNGLCVDHAQEQEYEALWTNIISNRDGDQLGMPAKVLELLARDKNDFAEHVDTILWSEFLASKEKFDG
jgi:hypothetical protein